MRRAWLTSAAAAVVLALGPMAPSSEASAATLTRAGGATIGTPLTTKAAGGNVIAVVPGASIVSDDHLSKQLDRGRTYTATFLIWVAPNARHPTVKVHADDGTVRRCSASKLSPGLAADLTCRVKPAARQSAVTNMTINVVVRTSNLGQYARSYTHQITN
jgi:hypothetical protein